MSSPYKKPSGSEALVSYLFRVQERTDVSRKRRGDTFTATRTDCPKIDSPIFCEFKTVFKMKID